MPKPDSPTSAVQAVRPPGDNPPLVSLEGISRRFGSLDALRDVHLSIRSGEIHAVAGENGAGKTTLMNVLFGHLRPDSGTVCIDGRPVTFRDPGDATRAGIGMVHQQLLIFPRLSAFENIVLGCEPTRWAPGRKASVREIARRSEALGFEVPLESAAEDLSFAHRQQIELLRVLLRGARVLILDEPTSLLAPPEVENLLRVLKRLRAEGLAIFFISHRIREVLELADRVTVLRKGKNVATLARREATADVLAGLIVGESPAAAGSVTAGGPDRGTREARPLIEVVNLATEPSGGEVGLGGLSFTIAEGEALGIGGVVGNGQRALAAALAGMARATSGTIRFDGREVTGAGVRERIRMGFRWLPANLLEEALLPRLSLWENLFLGHQRLRGWSRLGRLRTNAVKAWARERIDAANVVHSNIEQPASALSGGNQQKLVLGRLLDPSARLLILEQPSRGLDFKARERLHAAIGDLLRAGTAVLLISHDLDELLRVSHRIGILYRGRLRGIVDRDDARVDRLGRWMTSGGDAEPGEGTP